MSGDWADLSEAVSHALRHEPWLYELELDDAGWAPVDAGPKMGSQRGVRQRPEARQRRRVRGYVTAIQPVAARSSPVSGLMVSMVTL